MGGKMIFQILQCYPHLVTVMVLDVDVVCAAAERYQQSLGVWSQEGSL